MFLSSFYFEIFLYRHPGAGRDPLRRRHRRAATHIIIHWIATVAMLPRDDKMLSVLAHRTLMTWILGSASTHATRRAGPGPQDDMFLSSFYFEIFLYRHPGAGRDPLRRRQQRHILFTGSPRSRLSCVQETYIVEFGVSAEHCAGERAHGDNLAILCTC